MQNDLVKITGALMRGLAEESEKLRNKITTAKTRYKKDYYKKKLKKNNLKLMDVLTTMEKISRVQDKITQEDNKKDVQDKIQENKADS